MSLVQPGPVLLRLVFVCSVSVDRGGCASERSVTRSTQNACCSLAGGPAEVCEPLCRRELGGRLG